MKSQKLTEGDLFRMYQLSNLRAPPLMLIISSLDIIISWRRELNVQEKMNDQGEPFDNIVREKLSHIYCSIFEGGLSSIVTFT